MSSSSSSYFSFVKPIAGGMVGTPLKVLIKKPPRHDDDGSGLVTPVGSYIKVEQESREVLAEEQKNAQGESKAVSTSPAVKLANGQMLARRGTRIKRFNDKIKDCIFNSSLRMPRMNFRVKDRQIYHFSRLRRIDNALVSSTMADVAAEFDFKLSDVASSSEFTALFDQYRMAGIEFWIFPEYVMNTTVNTDPGTLISVIDLDDITAPSPVFDTLAQYQTAMISTGLEGHYRNFVPGILMDAQSTTGYLPKPAPWIDAAYDGLNHYGIKVGVTVTTAAQTYHAVIRYHFEFRKVR